MDNMAINYDWVLENFPTVCKLYRIYENINQREFADRVGVKQATVSRWEKGLSNPDVKTFFAVITLLVDLADEPELLSDTGEK